VLAGGDAAIAAHLLDVPVEDIPRVAGGVDKRYGSPAGSRTRADAALAGGPQVWTVAEAWQQHSKGERAPAVVADALGLTVADVETALAYWADYRDEIDELISRHHASQDESLHAWERRRALDAV